jgi:hypothetical protein
MGVQIVREANGHVSITVATTANTNSATVSPVEARLLAIKLLLAAEDVAPAKPD